MFIFILNRPSSLLFKDLRHCPEQLGRRNTSRVAYPIGYTGELRLGDADHRDLTQSSDGARNSSHGLHHAVT